MMRTTAWTSTWEPAANPFLDVPLEPRRRAALQWPMAPTHAAVWAIISARMRELFPMPDPAFDLAPWFGDFAPVDPLTPVRRELQAWLDGPTCPQRSESPWVGVMGSQDANYGHEAVFGHGFSLDCLVLDEAIGSDR